MKRIIKILVPILLVLIVLASIFWYLLIYDRGFTQNLILNRARAAEQRGNYKTSTWYYNLAYRHSHEDENVAIELAEQFKSIGNYTKAEYTLSNAIADGGSADLYIALCKTYVEQDKLRDAVAMLDNIADPAIKAELDAKRPQAPEPDHEEGQYTDYIEINFTTNSGKMYITTDGQYPSVNNQPLTEGLKLEGGETVIYAVSVADNGLVSPIRVLGYTVAGVVEEVTIEDPALDSIIREKLGVSSAHTLFTSQLWTITSLEITQDVQDLAELTKVPFLTDLTLNQGTYENLTSISSLANLKTLVIDGVTLDSAELSAIASLPSLSSLSLTRCNLSGISELSNATQLTYLDLSNNSISNIDPLSSLTELEFLNISFNAVSQLTALTSATKLRELDISQNTITSVVALSGCKSLEALRADHTGLANLEGLEKLTELQKLYVVGNQISGIEQLETLTKLTELDLSNNLITDLSALAGISSIRTLTFKSNQVSEIPKFAEDSALSYIDGSKNNISSLDSLASLKQLNYVIMEYNSGISSVASLSKCITLVQINIYGTSVTDVSDLEEMDVIIKYAPV